MEDSIMSAYQNSRTYAKIAELARPRAILRFIWELHFCYDWQESAILCG